jgi:hypothetical protein
MKCKFSKELLIGYFYQEIEPNEKEIVEAHLVTCPACNKELEGLTGTTKVLRVWPDEEPQTNLVFEPGKSSFWGSRLQRWPSSPRWRRLAVGVAAGAAVALVLLALFNFEASYSQGNFYVKIRLVPRTSNESISTQDPLLAPVTRRELAEWQQQSLRLVQEMLQASEERQRRELSTAFSQFARDLELQRRQDLTLVQKGFEVFQMSNDDRFRRTDEVLHQLLTVSQVSSPNFNRQK